MKCLTIHQLGEGIEIKGGREEEKRVGEKREEEKREGGKRSEGRRGRGKREKGREDGKQREVNNGQEREEVEEGKRKRSSYKGAKHQSLAQMQTHWLWSAQHLPIATPKLAQHTKRNCRHGIIWVVECLPESLHQLCSHRLDVIIEEVWLEIVNTKLEGPESLADERLRTIEC